MGLHAGFDRFRRLEAMEGGGRKGFGGDKEGILYRSSASGPGSGRPPTDRTETTARRDSGKVRVMHLYSDQLALDLSTSRDIETSKIHENSP